MADIMAKFRLIDNQKIIPMCPSITDHLSDCDNSEETKEGIKEMLEDLAKRNNMKLVSWKFENNLLWNKV